MKRSTQQIIASFPAAVLIVFPGLIRDSIGTPYGIVKPGEIGYQPVYSGLPVAELDQMVAAQYKTSVPSPAQREAALSGSMFGWDTPVADPENYDSRGEWIAKPKSETPTVTPRE